eukprot:997796-Rhodomonas_salina.1
MLCDAAATSPVLLGTIGDVLLRILVLTRWYAPTRTRRTTSPTSCSGSYLQTTTRYLLHDILQPITHRTTPKTIPRPTLVP